MIYGVKKDVGMNIIPIPTVSYPSPPCPYCPLPIPTPSPHIYPIPLLPGSFLCDAELELCCNILILIVCARDGVAHDVAAKQRTAKPQATRRSRSLASCRGKVVLESKAERRFG